LRLFILLALLVAGLSLTIVNASAAAHVVINEFDQNPPGDTQLLKDQWVELFNPADQPVDISLCQLVTTHGQALSIPIPPNSTIAPHDYLVVQPGIVWLHDDWEIILLKDAAGNVVDTTLNATDPYNDNRSWQRFPNGQETGTQGDWAFRLSTKGFSNGGETPVTPVTPPSPPSSGIGIAFVAIGAGAAAAAGGVGIALAVSSPHSSEVFVYYGYYYCRQHRIPVWSYWGWLWCPAHRRYLRP